MKKNKEIILAITIGIFCFLGIVSSSTYSLWRITKTQKTPNDIVASCLDISMQNESGSFGISEAWPMTDEEGIKLEGYTFEVKNNCTNKIRYIIGLNSLKIENANYLSYNYIKILLDDNNPRIYNSLNDLEYLDVRKSKLLNVETIEGGATNKHVVKAWIAENTPVTEQSKEFEGQIYITAGQNLVAYDECFTVDENGVIIDYEKTCGSEVVVPATIGGVKVKQITENSFDCKITSLDLSNAIYLDSIGTYAFFNNSIQTLLLPLNGVLKIIGSGAFMSNKLTNVIIPKSVEQIIQYAFSNNSISLVTFDGADDNTSKLWNLSGFSSNQLTEITIPTSVTSIGFSAFGGNAIKEIHIPDSVKLIDSDAFIGNKLTEIIIPYSVTRIKDQAFGGNDLTDVTFEDTEENPAQIKKIDQFVFANNELTKVVIPGSITSIDSMVFLNNVDLSQIIIKKETATGISLSSDWNKINCQNNVCTYANVTYNPNYTE